MILQCYLHSIYIFVSITGYEDDIFEVISNFQVQESKFGGKFYKLGGKEKNKINSADFMEFVFFHIWFVIAFRIALTLDVKIVWFGRQFAVCVKKWHKMHFWGVVSFKSTILTAYCITS